MYHELELCMYLRFRTFTLKKKALNETKFVRKKDKIRRGRRKKRTFRGIREFKYDYFEV